MSPARPLPGAVASPNIWKHTATYEIENRAVDPDGRLWSALEQCASWEGRVVLDLGCGTGFHLPAFAATASTVVGVEPHPDLLALAARRTRDLSNVTLLPGTAQAVPLPDASVDVVHVRWAYFFGPGCEPGLAEIERFWASRGWTRTSVDMGWRFTSRADLEAVVRIELKPDVADEVLHHHTGLEVDYAVNVWSRTF